MSTALNSHGRRADRIELPHCHLADGRSALALRVAWIMLLSIVGNSRSSGNEVLSEVVATPNTPAGWLDWYCWNAADGGSVAPVDAMLSVQQRLRCSVRLASRSVRCRRRGTLRRSSASRRWPLVAYVDDEAPHSVLAPACPRGTCVRGRPGA